MKWTPEKIKYAESVLVRHKDMGRAMDEIWNQLGDDFSFGAMRRAFGRAKRTSPHQLLGRAVKPIAVSDIPNTSHVPGAVNQVDFSSPSSFSGWTPELVNAFNTMDPKSVKVSPAVLYHDDTTRIVIISDLHCPYHDKAAWACLLQVIRETRPETVVIIGDFADCLAISSHPKSLDRKHDFAAEVEGVNFALDELRSAAGSGCRLVWTLGNHEDRITRYLQSSAPELSGIKELRAEGLFKVKERGIECIPYRDSIKIGNCSFTHDVGRCGVNTARQSLLDWGGNLVVGHSHRGGIAFQGEAKGSSHFCLNVGWLGDVDAIDYQHKMRVRRDHQCGFGIVDQSPSGFSWPTFVPVLNGECVVDGVLISGQKAAA